MAELFTNIGELVTNDPAHDGTPLGILTDAAILVEGGRIAWVGPRTAAPAADIAHDLSGCAVIPGFVDSHAHLVFAAAAEDVTRVMVDGRVVVRQGDRHEIGRELDAAVDAIWRAM